MRAARLTYGGLPPRAPGETGADRYSEAPPTRLGTRAEKRARGERVKARSSRPSQALEGRKPKGASSVLAALIRRRAARDSREGQSPGTAACRAGPSLRRRKQRQEKRYVGPPSRKRLGTS